MSKSLQILIGIAVVLGAITAGLYFYQQSSDAPANGDTKAMSAREQECMDFMTVAMFPDDGTAEEFLERCKAGEPVLPGEMPESDNPDHPDEPDLGTTNDRVGPGCAVGGCSSQICGEAGEVEDIATTCEYRDEYACYQSARCEKQADGQCGWTEDAELQQCLETAAAVDASVEVQ